MTWSTNDYTKDELFEQAKSLKEWVAREVTTLALIEDDRKDKAWADIRFLRHGEVRVSQLVQELEVAEEKERIRELSFELYYMQLGLTEELMKLVSFTPAPTTEPPPLAPQ
ncbi:unnamed protein product [Oppiella nova]|uniref:Uncharacterized protein n=1 Tax=Oppiella nova TaxID=334625 RepID=A0A7R9M9Z5_9ACAR|nr:unnamed protein product [Oppiella nova]CAG2173274.1 unnamed protein product [Oppiella nova]